MIDADCITPRSPRRFRRRPGERRSARAAEIGVRWARVATGLALEVRVGVAMVDDQIADIGDPGEGIREDEHRVSLAKRVDQQEDRPDQAQPPEGARHLRRLVGAHVGQLAERNLQRHRYVVQAVDGDRLLAALDLADELAGQAGAIAQPLLAESALLAERPQPLPQELPYVFHRAFAHGWLP